MRSLSVIELFAIRKRSLGVHNSVIQVTRKSLSELNIVGISAQTTNAAEMNPLMAKIPSLWGQFWNNTVLTKIPNKQENVIVGVYTNYEKDYQGAYTLIIGAPVTRKVDVIAGMTVVIIPAGTYLVFSNQGPVMPQIVMQTWQYIWQYFETNKQYQRAYVADIEWYDTSSPEKVEIYISIT